MPAHKDIGLAKLAKEEILKRLHPQAISLIEVVETEYGAEIRLLGYRVDSVDRHADVMKMARHKAADIVADVLIKLERLGWRPPV